MKDTFAALEPISLDELERKASLQRRIDKKYLVARDALSELIARVAETFCVLEIERERVFGYESVYFDTPALDCFHDQVAGPRPRYKARTRYYHATGTCVFEIKLKREDGETDKRSIEYDAERRHELDGDARALFEEALGAVNVGREPDHLEASLSPRFRRATLGAADATERVTVDSGVRLTVPAGDGLRLGDDYAIVECKSEDGDGSFDHLLADAGHEPISLSKYRLGVGQLSSQETDPDYAEEARTAFNRGRG